MMYFSMANCYELEGGPNFNLLCSYLAVGCCCFVCVFDDWVSCSSCGADGGFVSGCCVGGDNGGWGGWGVFNSKSEKDQS